jgi:RNA recognition motif-containing protein
LAVRLFVGNLSYSTSEADLRSYFGTVAAPSQVVLPVDRETGRPRGFAFVEFIDRAHAEQAIQKFNGQVFNGRPLAVSEARAREDRGPGGPRPGGGGFGGPRPGGPGGPGGGGFSGPRPGGFSGPPRPGGGGGFGGPRFDGPGAPPAARARNFGPDAKPQRGQSAKAKKKESERPRGPIPTKFTGRSFSLEDDSPDEALPDIDDFATSKPKDDSDAADDE